MLSDDTCGELTSRLVSDDIVGIVKASVQSTYLVLTTLKMYKWLEHLQVEH